MNIKAITDRIDRILVDLPKSPLRGLNSYVVRGDSRNLVIDTGFHLDESFADLQGGIRELGLDMSRTDIFLTHCHADHAGNAGRTVREGGTVYAGARDKALLEEWISDSAGLKDYISGRMVKFGVPEEKRLASLRLNPSIKNNEDILYPIEPIGDGHVFDLGGISLRAICTPGHTPDHMCLSVDSDGILFTGDHVLFDITPNITEWSMMDNALGSYMDSLRATKQMDVSLALPAHRESGDLIKRVDALLMHHEARLEEALKIVAGKQGQTSYEIASQMKWRISCDNWEAFPLSQLYFAVGETKAHLRHLEALGDVRVEAVAGVDYYTAA